MKRELAVTSWHPPCIQETSTELARTIEEAPYSSTGTLLTLLIMECINNSMWLCLLYINSVVFFIEIHKIRRSFKSVPIVTWSKSTTPSPPHTYKNIKYLITLRNKIVKLYGFKILNLYFLYDIFMT